MFSAHLWNAHMKRRPSQTTVIIKAMGPSVSTLTENGSACPVETESDTCEKNSAQETEAGNPTELSKEPTGLVRMCDTVRGRQRGSLSLPGESSTHIWIWHLTESFPSVGTWPNCEVIVSKQLLFSWPSNTWGIASWTQSLFVENKLKVEPALLQDFFMHERGTRLTLGWHPPPCRLGHHGFAECNRMFLP